MFTRRMFLHSSSAFIALPFLESILPRAARAAGLPGAPVRFMSYFMPLGMMMDAWLPPNTGANFTLSPTLQPLAPYQSYLTVVSGTNNDIPNQPPGVGGGGHARGTAAFGTASRIAPAGSPPHAGTSADQLVAQSIGQNSRIDSLQIGLPDTATNDGQFANNYNGSASWSSPSTNLPPVMSAKTIFNRLFPNGATPTTPTQPTGTPTLSGRADVQKSILDSVVHQAKSLQSRLGTDDSKRVDQYLTSLREVEQSIAQGSAPLTCTVPGAPAPASDLDTQATQMSQLMTLAFQCDITRVQSFMFGAGESYRVYHNLGLNAQHHYISHYNSGSSGLGAGDAIAALKQIQVYAMGHFAKMLAMMQQVKEGAGTLLDNVVIVYSSELTDSDKHSYDNMPIFLMGHAGGRIKSGGQHIAVQNTDTAQVWLAAMRAVGVNPPSFGSRGETQSLPGIL